MGKNVGILTQDSCWGDGTGCASFGFILERNNKLASSDNKVKSEDIACDCIDGQ